MMACRGICEQHVTGRPASGSMYGGGRCRCQTCGVWLRADAVAGSSQAGNRCPCCGQRVRFARRGAGKRLREAAMGNTPGITVRPFYDNAARYMGMNDNLQADAAVVAASAGLDAYASAPKPLAPQSDGTSGGSA